MPISQVAENDAIRTDLVAMTAGGPHAWIMINALRAHFGPFPVIREAGEPARTFWKRRLKRLGPVSVAGQFATRIFTRLTKPLSRARIPELIGEHDLQPEPVEDQAILDVASVNSDAARAHLRRLSPRAVFVVSTRMIAARTLDATDTKFINYHSGINPAYRGINGGYFALARGEPELFGTTLHLVDEGVDTGDILYQAHLTPGRRDNIHTYMWLMAARSRDIAIKAMEDALAGRLAPYRRDLPSRQYFAPTVWFYFWAGLRRGVW